MDGVLELLEFPVDFEGQQAISKFNYLLAGAACVTSLVVSIALSNVLYSVYVFAVFFAIDLVVTLPAYPGYNVNKLEFCKRPAPKKIQVELD